jgi:hypothetical protein
MPNDSTLIDDIHHCLSLTVEAVRTGRLDRLVSLAADLGALEKRLVGAAPTARRAELEKLRAEAEQSLRHLTAARDGIRAATERVRQIARIPSELSTYDRAGRGSTVQFDEQSLEHRA